MAANLKSSGDDEMISGINVTPLVDVVLVLLVIFMITAPMMYQSALKVNLPAAKSSERVERVTLRLTLGKDGRLAAGNRLITNDQLAEVVKEALKKDAQADAVISADSGTEHGAVVSLIDSVRTAGITKFAISVKATALADAKRSVAK